MNKRHQLAWAIGLLLFLAGCKKGAVPLTSNPEKINKVTIQNLDFEYLSARGRMQLEEEGDKVSSNINVRIKKDSVIWISVVPGLGIEVARVRITKDSVHVVNRMKKEYFAGDYSIVKQKFKIDVNFDLIQSILLGNYITAPNAREKIIAETPLQHSRQEIENLLVDQFVDATSFKLKKLTIKDQATKNNISVDYSQFEQINDKLFAKAALIQVMQPQDKDGKIKGAIGSVEYNKITINEGKLTFPFSRPEGYTNK